MCIRDRGIRSCILYNAINTMGGNCCGKPQKAGQPLPKREKLNTVQSDRENLARMENIGIKVKLCESTILPNLQVADFVWSNGSCTFKQERNGWLSLLSLKPLPKHFEVHIKVVELRGTPMCSNGGIGVTTKSNIIPKSCIGNDSTEYAIMPQCSGECFIYGGRNANPVPYGREYINNDVVTVVYRKDRTLSFEINGEDQGVAFRNVEGPFYLMASLFFAGSQLDIANVIELRCLIQSFMPVSYTHLTLPTICSV
eukprot:TRINITY_DN10518_c0_g1_i9.p1 TRINITY_DN10518_c0_g1~~TRINITY_DN10518_c0_g1_i9.p1  ORF type:complete len:255 (-),score=17.03 TRINITY_DN10518_c0_g1_i9:44-808(-)